MATKIGLPFEGLVEISPAVGAWTILHKGLSKEFKQDIVILVEEKRHTLPVTFTKATPRADPSASLADTMGGLMDLFQMPHSGFSKTSLLRKKHSAVTWYLSGITNTGRPICLEVVFGRIGFFCFKRDSQTLEDFLKIMKF